jgi:hypothetical protein
MKQMLRLAGIVLVVALVAVSSADAGVQRA